MSRMTSDPRWWRRGPVSMWTSTGREPPRPELLDHRVAGRGFRSAAPAASSHAPALWTAVVEPLALFDAIGPSSTEFTTEFAALAADGDMIDAWAAVVSDLQDPGEPESMVVLSGRTRDVSSTPIAVVIAASEFASSSPLAGHPVITGIHRATVLARSPIPADDVLLLDELGRCLGVGDGALVWRADGQWYTVSRAAGSRLHPLLESLGAVAPAELHVDELAGWTEPLYRVSLDGAVDPITSVDRRPIAQDADALSDLRDAVSG